MTSINYELVLHHFYTDVGLRLNLIYLSLCLMIECLSEK